MRFAYNKLTSVEFFILIIGAMFWFSFSSFTLCNIKYKPILSNNSTNIYPSLFILSKSFFWDMVKLESMSTGYPHKFARLETYCVYVYSLNFSILFVVQFICML